MVDITSNNQNYTILDLSSLPEDEQDAYLDQVFEILRQKGNYAGVYGNSESKAEWKAGLGVTNPITEGKTAVRIALVMDKDGKVAGFSYGEFQPRGNGFIGYACADENLKPEDRDNVFSLDKLGMTSIARGMSLDKAFTGVLGQEHITVVGNPQKDKVAHHQKADSGHIVGQYPLVDQNGLPIQYNIPVYKGDIYALMELEEGKTKTPLEEAFGELFTDPEDKKLLTALPGDPSAEAIGARVEAFMTRLHQRAWGSGGEAKLTEVMDKLADMGTTPATLYISDPSLIHDNPTMKAVDFYENFKNDYMAKNSVFKQFQQFDPFVKRMDAIIDQIRNSDNPNITIQDLHNNAKQAFENLEISVTGNKCSQAFKNAVVDISLDQVKTLANNPDILTHLKGESAQERAQNAIDRINDPRLGLTEKKQAMKDLAVELLYRSDNNPEVLKTALKLYAAAADDGPNGQKGNFQALRDMSRFYYEGGINGKSFKELGIGDFIKKDSYHAYELGKLAILAHPNPDKFNDASGIKLDPAARAHQDHMQRMEQDKALDSARPALQEQPQQAMVIS